MPAVGARQITRARDKPSLNQVVDCPSCLAHITVACTDGSPAGATLARRDRHIRLDVAASGEGPAHRLASVRPRTIRRELGHRMPVSAPRTPLLATGTTSGVLLRGETKPCGRNTICPCSRTHKSTLRYRVDVSRAVVARRPVVVVFAAGLHALLAARLASHTADRFAFVDGAFAAGARPREPRLDHQNPALPWRRGRSRFLLIFARTA